LLFRVFQLLLSCIAVMRAAMLQQTAFLIRLLKNLAIPTADSFLVVAAITANRYYIMVRAGRGAHVSAALREHVLLCVRCVQ
jgi:hypothetical protein